MKFSNRSIRWSKSVVFSASLVPVFMLTWRAAHQHLGANPVEELTHVTGEWTLRFIVITLLLSPFRRVAGIPDLIRFRRMIGLFGFFYGGLHLLIYLWLDKFFDWHDIWQDIGKRRFITMGLFALLLMVPLALTSTSGSIRRLGGRRWQLLHRLVYVTAAAGVVHYYWLVKSDIRLPVLYGMIVTILLMYRIPVFTPIRANNTRLRPQPNRFNNAAAGIIWRRLSLQCRGCACSPAYASDLEYAIAQSFGWSEIAIAADEALICSSGGAGKRKALPDGITQVFHLPAPGST